MMILPYSCEVPLGVACKEPACGLETPTNNLPFGLTETRAGCREVPPLDLSMGNRADRITGQL